MTDDAELVERARQGDQAAFSELVARHVEAARRVAAQFGAGDDADDVVQEALVKAYRRLGEYRGESSFRSWLTAIVANETRNLHRSRRRRSEAGARAAVANPEPPAVDLAVQEALAAEQRRELVAAVRHLSAPEREVIASRFLLDRSEAETAAQLDLPVGTVKSRTSRALARLRTHLGVALAVAAAVLAIIVIPPARKAVADFLSDVIRFAGVEIRTMQPAGPLPTSAAPLPTPRAVTLAEARQLSPFKVGVPTALGPPDEVWLADPGPDGAPRVVTLLYHQGSVRVDEFDGRFDLSFTKSADDVTALNIGPYQAMWIASAHQLTYVDRHGVSVPATTRLSAPTLIVQRDAVAYRFEGFQTPADAVAAAESIATS